jgi:hypothetical protein
MPVVYPSAVARLVLRFDRGAVEEGLRERLPRTHTTTLQGFEVTPDGVTDIPEFSGTGGRTREQLNEELDAIQARINVVESSRDLFSPEAIAEELADLRRQRAELESQVDGLAGAAAQTQADITSDGDTVIGAIMVRSAEIDRNGLREADTCSVVIDHRDAPFDPRLIRSCGIEVTFGIVDADDWSLGMSGVRGPDELPLSIVGRAPAESDELAPGTSRFLGIVDTWTVELGSDDGDTIKLECRDLSALLIESEIPQGFGLDMALPLDDCIRGLIDLFPMLRGTRVVYEGPGTAPVPLDAVPRTARPRRGRGGTRSRRRAMQTVWDSITDICVQTGLVPIWQDNRLRIVDPRTFYTDRDTARRMVYGRNIKELSFSRKLGGMKVPTVEVRCVDQDRGRTRWARFPVPDGAPREGVFGETDPPRPARPNEVPPSGATPEDRILTFVVSGLSAPGSLARAAEAIWHQIGRQELEGSFDTEEVSSWDQPVMGVDLLRLHPGDAVEILVARDEQSRTPAGAALVSGTELASLTREARTEYLARVGWRRDVAERFARLQDATQFQTIFRVGTVRIQYAADSGISVGCDWQNFLEVREMASVASTQSRTVLQGFVVSPEGVTDVAESDALAFAERARQEREGLTQARADGVVSPEEYERRVVELEELEITLGQEDA